MPKHPEVTGTKRRPLRNIPRLVSGLFLPPAPSKDIRPRPQGVRSAQDAHGPLLLGTEQWLEAMVMQGVDIGLVYLYRLLPGQSMSVDEGQWVQGILCSRVQGVPLPLSRHPPMGPLGPPGSVELRASKGGAWDLHETGSV